MAPFWKRTNAKHQHYAAQGQEFQHHGEPQQAPGYSQEYALGQQQHPAHGHRSRPSHGQPQSKHDDEDQKQLLWESFCAVDQDGSGSISVPELQYALLNDDWTPFDRVTLDMLMRIFDENGDGEISFSEFVGLEKYVRDWQKVFWQFDADHSGTIDHNELSMAMNSGGYNLSESMLFHLEDKYASLSTEDDPNPGITFDRFLRACVAVRHFDTIFKKMIRNRNGLVGLNLDMLMDIVLSAP